jgi:hypothetical protein
MEASLLRGQHIPCVHEGSQFPANHSSNLPGTRCSPAKNLRVQPSQASYDPRDSRNDPPLLGFLGLQVRGFQSPPLPAFQPSGLHSGRSFQQLLPSGPPGGSTAWTSVLTSALPTLHVLGKLQLRQRICVLFLLISFVYFVYLIVPKRVSISNTAFFYTRSSTTIRFSSGSGQYVVSTIHPGRQFGQACILPAFDDGPAGPCLLD